MPIDMSVLALAHVLGLTYWLGADLGVFYSSYYVANERLSAETRVTVAGILFWLDQAPRIMMPLMLGTGVHLAFRFSVLPLSATAVVACWAVVVFWLSLVLLLHRLGPSPSLSRVDFALRVGVILAAGGYAAAGYFGGSLVYWVALKLAIFAGLVACGLAVRIALRPFGPAFAALSAGNPSDADNAVIRAVFARTRPFVVLIWAGLVANTALGLHLL